MTASVTFDTTVAATGNKTGIVVPDKLIERLNAGRRPAVLVNVNGYEYRNTVGVMGGKHMVSISAAIRKETGLKGGDPIAVKLTVAETPGRSTSQTTWPAPSPQSRTSPPSSPSSRTACSGTTSTTSTARRRRKQGSVALTRRSPSSDKVISARADSQAFPGRRVHPARGHATDQGCSPDIRWMNQFDRSSVPKVPPERRFCA